MKLDFFLLSVSLLTNFSHINLVFQLLVSLAGLKASSSLPLEPVVLSTTSRGRVEIHCDSQDPEEFN